MKIAAIAATVTALTLAACGGTQAEAAEIGNTGISIGAELDNRYNVDAEALTVTLTPEVGYNIAGFGLETFASQALSQDANNDGIPDFLGRYAPYFETAGATTTGGIEALRRGIGALGEGKTFFGPAAQYVSGGRGMYDPSQYVSSYMIYGTPFIIPSVVATLQPPYFCFGEKPM